MGILDQSGHSAIMHDQNSIRHSQHFRQFAGDHYNRLARGRKAHDKREVSKKRDWDREKARLMREKG